MIKASTLCGFLLTLAVSTFIWADVVALKDGTTYDGELQPRDAQGNYVLKTKEGKTLTFAPERVQNAVIKETVTTTQKASGSWDSLLTQSKKLEDLGQIITLHDKYLTDFPDSEHAAEAKEARTKFVQMQSDGFVKYRGTWMAQTKADSLMRQAAADAQEARTLLAAGQIKEAEEKVNSALVADSQNMTALIVGGMLRCGQNNMPAAREFFARIIILHDTDPLARNNLAIISFRQNRQPEGLIHFTKALQGAATNRLIVDNIALALTKYTGSKDIPAYKDLVTPYKQAEAKLSASMAAKGLYRCGTTWGTKEECDKIAANIKSVKDKIAVLEQNIARQNQALTALDTDLKATIQNYNNRNNDAINYQNLINNNNNNPRQNYNLNNWVINRDAALRDMDTLSRRKKDLENQRSGLQTSIKQMNASGTKLLAELAKAQLVSEKNILRLLDIGEVENPPAPIPPTIH